MDYKQLCEDLRHIEDIAYEYNFNNEVLGIDVNEFENLMSNAAYAIETLQIELVAMRGAANSYKMENERLLSKLNEALSDLNKVSVCGTCVHYRPHGKETQCDIKKLWKMGGNWAGVFPLAVAWRKGR